MSNPFEIFEYTDGFFVDTHEMTGLQLSLHAGLRAGGELVRPFPESSHGTSHELIKIEMPQPHEAGQISRLHMLGTALCNFFNAGGSWEEVAQLTDSLKQVIRGRVVFDGWYLVECYTDNQGCFTTLWSDGEGQYTRWVHGEYIDTEVTAATLQRELDEDDDEEDDDGGEDDS
jgi:hypothetical protein